MGIGIGTGLLALALLAAEGPSSGPPGEPISFQVRMMTVVGLDWRAEAYPRLQPVARQGTSTVWTTDHALADDLAASARWSVAAQSEPTSSNFGKTSPVFYVAHVGRSADGPINGASAVSFQPEMGRVDAGFQANIRGRKLDQGVLARLTLQETYVKAVHTVGLKETCRTPDKINVDFTAPEAKEGVKGFQVIQTSTKGKETQVTAQVQLPEVVRTKVEGEWLIPTDGVLLISLGVDTSADEHGKAIVIERLAVLETIAKPGASEIARRGRPLADWSLCPSHARLAFSLVAGGD